MWILDIDPEEIKNPFEGYIDVTENIRMAKSQGFERFRKLLLAHAHKVDIDEALEDYYQDETNRGKPFSQFLQSKLTQEGKNETDTN